MVYTQTSGYISGPMWIIVEDYEPEHIEETLTNVLPYWYPTEYEALEALHDIARDLMVEIDSDTSKFLAPPQEGIYRDTYYIMELDRG